MISHIFIFNNDMVAVCDDKGRQIPKLQGRYSEKKSMIEYLIKKYPEVLVSR